MNNTSPQVASSPSRSSKIVIRKIARPPRRLFYRFIKRTFDFVVALVASVFLIIPMIVIALLIHFDSKGPAFYRQERLGLDGKPMCLWKFRSMRIDAEKNGAQWATADDDRCARVGKYLRMFRLDELPQIPFNILPGNLSFVGPRPERQVFYEQFAEYIDGFEQRLYVKPGLTGLAQVNGGYDLLPEEKIIYDIEYIEKQSVKMDIQVILKTIAIVFNHDGAR